MADKILTTILLFFSYGLVFYLGIDIGKAEERVHQIKEEIERIKEEIAQIEKSFRELKEKQV